nr:unnamed protein product [Digitaria exilis]
MFARRSTTGKEDAPVCYMNAPLPYAIEENHGGCFFDDDDDLAEVLQDQVCHGLSANLLSQITHLGRKPPSSSASDRGNCSASRPPQVVEEDGIDPDNMTYEV